jgi:hypothetical protein
MARQWLSFWNQETRTRQSQGGTSRTRPSDANIFVPYGQGQVAVGDSVYCVAIDHGELLLFGRVLVGRIEVDPTHAESLDVWEDPGSKAFEIDEKVVDGAIANDLVYFQADGSEHHLPCDTTGKLLGTAFQGRSSIRELSRGSEGLDALLTS